MASKDQKKDSPAYLIVTPVEELIEEGMQFEGDDEKTRMLNQIDFTRLRTTLQRCAQVITRDAEESLIRCLKCCVKCTKE